MGKEMVMIDEEIQWDWDGLNSEIYSNWQNKFKKKNANDEDVVDEDEVDMWKIVPLPTDVGIRTQEFLMRFNIGHTFIIEKS